MRWRFVPREFTFKRPIHGEGLTPADGAAVTELPRPLRPRPASSVWDAAQTRQYN
jgi:hypothetical protein